MGTLIGIGVGVNSYTGTGLINLYEGLTFSGPNWTDEGSGVYSHIPFTGTGDYLAVSDKSFLSTGATYTIVFNVDARVAGSVYSWTGGTEGTAQLAPIDNFEENKIANNQAQNQGFQTNTAASGIRISNLRIYLLSPAP